MESWDVAVADQLTPALQVALVRLTGHSILETVQVAVNCWLPLFEAAAIELRGEGAVELPRPTFGASELGKDGPANDLEAAAHARQEPVELLVAEVDALRQETADARLSHAAEPGQIGLSGGRLDHHLAQQLTPTRHAQTIAVVAMATVAASLTQMPRARPISSPPS